MYEYRFGDMSTNGTAVGSGSNEVWCPIPSLSTSLAMGVGTNLTLMLPYLTRPAHNCTTSKIVNGTTVASFPSLTSQALALKCTSSSNTSCTIITDCGIHENVTITLFRLAVIDPDWPSHQRFLPISPSLFTYYPDDDASLDPYYGNQLWLSIVCWWWCQ
jgi:hypothetical protein